MIQFRPRMRGWRAWAIGFALLVAIAAVLSPAAAEELRPGERATVPGSEIAYLADPGGTVTLSQALAAFDAGEARPLQGEVPDFGAVFSTFWLFVPVENTGTGNGSWFVATRAPFFPALKTRWNRAKPVLRSCSLRICRFPHRKRWRTG